MILSVCKTLKKWQLLYIANGITNSLNQFGEQFLNLYLIVKCMLPYDPSILLINSEENFLYVHKEMCIRMFILARFKIIR